MKPDKETKDDIIKEVFRATNDEIKRRGQTMCQEHTWRKLSDNELVCIKCPTVIIVDNPDEYAIEN